MLSRGREVSSPKSSPSPTGLASQEHLVSGIACLHCQDVSCGTHSGAALNCSPFFQVAPWRLQNVIFNIGYIQGPDIHLQLLDATSIWPKAYNTLVSQECVNLAQKPSKQPSKVLISFAFPDSTSPDLRSQHVAYSTPRGLFSL